MRYLRILPAVLSAGLLLAGAGALSAQATERAPSNATAKCNDGSYSAAKNPRGACARHRGIAQWLGRQVATAAPAGAAARCGDGTYSKSNGQGACSRHGGIAERIEPTTARAQNQTPDSDVRQNGNPTATAEQQSTPATARCGDGTYSNAVGRGACARHGGVAVWLSDSSAVSTSQDIGAPEGATARCKDGTYSKSTHRSGTCSFHRGVAEWLRATGGQ